MRRSVVSEDSSDFYNRRLAWLAVPLTAAWCVWTFGIRTFLFPPSHSLESVSRDAGLRMTLLAPFPWWLLWGHSLAGAALLAGVMWQKRLVSGMAHGEGGATRLHRWNGYAVLGAMLVMSGAGMGMAPFSSWDNFSAFSVAFAAPWLLWAVTIYASARAHKWGAHRLAGNQALKGCLTVPLARLGGAALQRAAPELGQDWGYYAGIGAVTLAMALWEMADLRRFFAAPYAPDARRRDKAKQT